MSGSPEKKGKSELKDLAKQVTEAEMTQRRKVAVNPIPHSSPDTSLTYVQGHIIKRHEKVYLNIYNLTTLNSCLRTCGIAIYHSAIEVYGVEYAFGGLASTASGVFETKPFHRLAEDGLLPVALTLHEQHCITNTKKSPREIAALVEKLAPLWPGNTYDLIRRNCNHFARDLASLVSSGKTCQFQFPAHVNRIASVATAVSCCLPASLRHTTWPIDESVFTGTGRRVGAAFDQALPTDLHLAAQLTHRGTEGLQDGEAEEEYAAEARRRESEIIRDVARVPCSEENVRSYAALAAIRRAANARQPERQKNLNKHALPVDLHLLAKGGMRHDVPPAGTRAGRAPALPQQLRMPISREHPVKEEEEALQLVPDSIAIASIAIAKAAAAAAAGAAAGASGSVSAGRVAAAGGGGGGGERGGEQGAGARREEARHEANAASWRKPLEANEAAASPREAPGPLYPALPPQLEASAEHAAGSGVAGGAGGEEDIEKPVYYGEESTNSEGGTSSSSSLSPLNNASKNGCHISAQ